MSTAVEKPNPKTHVRVTLRMQWETTIVNFETFIPADYLAEYDNSAIFETWAEALWMPTLDALKEASVQRMWTENQLE